MLISIPLNTVTLKSEKIVDREAIRIIIRRRVHRLVETEIETLRALSLSPEPNMEEDQTPPPPPLVNKVVDPPLRRMREYILLNVVKHPSCIVLNQNLRFEIKPNTQVVSSSCLLCDSVNHGTQGCQLALQYLDFVEEH